jgi:hypothetical protein
MHEQIVRKITRKEVALDDSRKQFMNHPLELSLLPQQSQLLPTFPTMQWYNQYSKYLVKKVRRNPRDLRSHVQRTIFFLAKGDAEALYGALIDLFVILGNRGIEIRRNLLTRSKQLLEPQQYEFLTTHLEDGLDTNKPLPINMFSSLTKGQSGTSTIVRQKNSDASALNPVEQAKQLRLKDWLTAMVILENALQHDPGDANVCRELLSLYKQQNTREAFYKTYTGLIGRCLALPQLWADTEQFFLDSAEY